MAGEEKASGPGGIPLPLTCTAVGLRKPASRPQPPEGLRSRYLQMAASSFFMRAAGSHQIGRQFSQRELGTRVDRSVLSTYIHSYPSAAGARTVVFPCAAPLQFT